MSARDVPHRTLRESPLLAGALIVAGVIWLDWGSHHPFSAVAVGLWVAVPLVGAPDIITWFSRYRGTAAAMAAAGKVAAQSPVRKLARWVIATGIVVALVAAAIIRIGTDAEWPAFLGYGGIVTACLGLAFALTAFAAGVVTDAVVELAGFDRKISLFVTRVFGANASFKMAGAVAILAGVCEGVDHRFF